MQIGVLGTGKKFGQPLASKLIELGHEVMMGSRKAPNPVVIDWVSANGDRAHGGTLTEAATFGEILFVAVDGLHTMDALEQAGADAIGNKVLIDVTNPITRNGSEPWKHSPPEGFLSNGEAVQATYPNARVVKGLNTMSPSVGIHPSRLEEGAFVTICGNDVEAKSVARSILESFGWTRVLDFGGISFARLTEAQVPFSVAVGRAVGEREFGLGVVSLKPDKK